MGQSPSQRKSLLPNLVSGLTTAIAKINLGLATENITESTKAALDAARQWLDAQQIEEEGYEQE